MRSHISLLLFFSVMQIFGQTPELIFHSGFEPNTTDTTNGVAADIFGADNSVSPPNDWIFDLETHPNIGDFSIQFQGGDDTMRWARIVPDPTDSFNKVFHYWLKYPNVGGTKGRVQANIYGNENLYEIYQKVRLYLPGDWDILKAAPAKIEWLTIMEFWNNLPFQDPVHPFRITLGIHKKDTLSPKLTFNLEAQIMPDPPPWPVIWEESDTSYSIPVEQWMTLEFFFREGDSANGRFVFAVTPDGGPRQILFDVTNYTHHPDDADPDGLVRYNPMKLYSSDALINYVRESGGVLQVYWDDFELWKDVNLITSNSPDLFVLDDFRLSPNPMSQFALLEFENSRHENHRLELCDLQGRIVRVVENITADQILIEKNNLLSGLYFFRLYTDGNTIAAGKLMVR